jgi:hypothetical protein
MCSRSRFYIDIELNKARNLHVDILRVNGAI